MRVVDTPDRFSMKTALFALLLIFAGSCKAQQPLSLADAVRQALDRRPELKSAAARSRAGNSLTLQAGVFPNPRLIFQTENLRTTHFDYGQDADTFLYASQVVETSGRRGARVRLARTIAGRARLEEEQIRRDIAVQVTEAYWNAIASEALLKLYEENNQYFAQIVEYHEARLREGKAAEVDVIRVRLEHQRIAAATENARTDAEKTRLELARAIGYESSDWRLTEDLGRLENPRAINPDSAARVESKLAAQSLLQARSALILERANGRPDLDVILGYKRIQGLNTALAGLQFNLPLFNRNQGAIGAAEANVQAAEQDAESAHLLLRSELEIARREYETRRRQIEKSFRPLRDRAVEISNISRMAYKEGGIDLLRLIDAERLRIESEISLIRLLNDYHKSVAQLDRAEGVEP
jgi:cobalt-zinc-cadmium efflux system outer membrane protein